MKKRLDENIDNCENFEIKDGLLERHVLDGIKAEYDRNKLQHIAGWGTGSLPRIYANPKNKDPVKKCRIIASYFKFPLRRLYRIVSKACTWLLRQLPSKYRHFTLHMVNNTKNRAQEGLRKLKNIFGANTELICFQSDVKQMYTNLSPQEIRKAIKWLLHIIKKHCPKRNQYNEILTVNRDFNIKYPDNVRWGKGMDEENTVTVTFENIIATCNMDLKFSYAKAKGILYYQKIGCPIGGYLSAFYANTVCAFHEWKFLVAQGQLENRICGIRQMDDLMVWIATEKGNRMSTNFAHKMKKLILKQNGVYKGGLELEEEEVAEIRYNEKNYYLHHFAGTELLIRKTDPIMSCRTLNKNRTNIERNETQTIVRYPPWQTYVNKTTLKGVIIGNIYRIIEQCSNHRIAIECILENYKEYRAINYPKYFYQSTVRKLQKREQKSDDRKKILHMVSVKIQDST